MKALLDENLPVKLKYRFSSALTVFTVNDMQWNSLKNGELLRAIGENNFDVLITSDKNIIHQHNISKFPFLFVILYVFDNQYDTILPLVPAIEQKIFSATEQVIVVEGKTNLSR
jgi:predicted nuclease of predicted toxin-antitoxin system